MHVVPPGLKILATPLHTAWARRRCRPSTTQSQLPSISCQSD